MKQITLSVLPSITLAILCATLITFFGAAIASAAEPTTSKSSGGGYSIPRGEEGKVVISEVSRTSTSSADRKVLTHTVQFTLTANDTAIYIPTGTSGRGGAIQWQNVGLRSLTGTLSSEANKVDGRYLIAEGESERFTLTYVTNVRFSYPADPVVGGIRYSTSATGRLMTVKFPKAERVTLPEKPTASTSPAKTYCVSGKENFSEGTERTSIVNADGTTSVVSDARFVCRIKDGKGVWERTGSLPGKPSDGTFNTAVSNLTATVSFTLSNGCGGYIISWGDGAKTELAGSPAGSKCTMAIVNVSKEHTYAKGGTYKVKVERFNGSALKDTSTKEIKVGTESSSTYTLTDIKSVTKEFVDPNKAVADEEYTLYVITLQTGRNIEVKIYGRTVPGTTEEAFRKTGYTGNVAELLARATEVTGNTNPVCIKGKPVTGGGSSTGGRQTQECLGTEVTNPASTTPGTRPENVKPVTQPIIGTTSPSVPNKVCRWQDKNYKEGDVRPNAVGTSGFASNRMTQLSCQNGEWKPAKQSGVSTSAPKTSTTTNSGAPSVRGAAVDVYQEIATILVSVKQLLDTLEAK